MGFKRVCLTCKSAFSVGSSVSNAIETECTVCNKFTYLVHHKFKPPPKAATQKWQVVSFLILQGFRYETYWEPVLNEKGQPFMRKAYGKFPESMREAKEFMMTYNQKNQI
jgi:hypothetical protein